MQGEELKAEDVLKIIDIIKDNAINLETTSSKELKIELSDNNSNNQLIETLKDFLEKEKSRNYSVKVEYNNDGLVKYMVLTILDKKN